MDHAEVLLAKPLPGCCRLTQVLPGLPIVGPLPRTISGNCYILVLCDYATRYPEAFTVRSIDAECIADVLVWIFTRVGIS